MLITCIMYFSYMQALNKPKHGVHMNEFIISKIFVFHDIPQHSIIKNIYTLTLFSPTLFYV